MQHEHLLLQGSRVALLQGSTAIADPPHPAVHHALLVLLQVLVLLLPLHVLLALVCVMLVAGFVGIIVVIIIICIASLPFAVAPAWARPHLHLLHTGWTASVSSRHTAKACLSATATLLLRLRWRPVCICFTSAAAIRQHSPPALGSSRLLLLLCCCQCCVQHSWRWWLIRFPMVTCRIDCCSTHW